MVIIVPSGFKTYRRNPSPIEFDGKTPTDLSRPGFNPKNLAVKFCHLDFPLFL